jgi:hypothetical protein
MEKIMYAEELSVPLLWKCWEEDVTVPIYQYTTWCDFLEAVLTDVPPQREIDTFSINLIHDRTFIPLQISAMDLHSSVLDYLKHRHIPHTLNYHASATLHMRHCCFY